MTQIFEGILTMWLFVCFEALMVIMAMAVDFASGFYKAKLRGEERNSYGLKRTVSKFILYVGSICIACGIDSIFFACRFWDIIHISALRKIPVVTTLIAVFILIVEMRSVWEKAEAKQRREALKTAQIVSNLINKDTLREAITEAITNIKDNTQ